jgi:hypothetical protein
MDAIAHCVREVFKTLDVPAPDIHVADDVVSFHINEYLISIDSNTIKLTNHDCESTIPYQSTADVYDFLSEFIGKYA